MSKSQYSQEEKLKVVKMAEEVGPKEAARIAGIHYTTVYEWRSRVEALGEEAFVSTTPRHPGRGVKPISKAQEEAVLSCWRNNPGYGPGQVRNQLRRQGQTVSIRTVRKIMTANGYQPARRKGEDKACQRFEAARPLELAQMDILEFYINKLKVYLILLIDDFSRFVLGWRLLEQTSIDDVIELVRSAMDRYGKPEEILTDRGFVFYSWRGANRFERYLENERIDHTHASAHHPQTLGKVEALNKRIKTELIDRRHFATAQEAGACIQDWISHYNFDRPHQGLGGFLVPAERFKGQADRVLKQIAEGMAVSEQIGYVERSLVNLVLSPDGKLVCYLLGRPVAVEAGV